MIVFPLAMSLLGLLGQADMNEAAATDPEVLRVLAIHATQEGREQRYLDPTLLPFDSYLADLPYDTFREEVFEEVRVAYGATATVALGTEYGLHFSPEKESELGEVIFAAHIDLTGGEAPVHALKVSGRAARGQGVVFRGLSLPEGEMIVIMSIAKADEGGGGAGSGNQKNDNSDADGDGEEESGGASGAGGQQGGNSEAQVVDLVLESPPDPEEENDPAEELTVPGRDTRTPEFAEEAPEESPLPPDLANLEGILRALEEQDMIEQRHSRNRRYDVVIQGDWW